MRFIVPSWFILTLLSCVQFAPDDATSRIPLENIALLGEKNILCDAGRIISLSPDGRYFVALKDTRLTVLGASSLQTVMASAITSYAIDLRTIVWSPNSRYIAFTEDYPQSGVNSDLWIVDLQKKAVVNLTDDMLQGPVESPATRSEKGNIDICPCWSADNRRILFVRMRYGDPSSRFCSIDIQSRKVLELFDIGPHAVWYGVRWQDGKNRIIYTSGNGEANNRDDGIWVLDMLTGKKKALAGPTGNKKSPVLKDVTPDGSLAIICYFSKFSSQPASAKSFFYLLDLETGGQKEIVSCFFSSNPFYSTLNAVFSPDGAKLLISFQREMGRYCLTIQDRKGKNEKLLQESGERWGTFSFLFGRGICWSSNASIFVRYDIAPNKGKILYLGKKM